MFVCHTPPFRKRSRRGFNRPWRCRHGLHGALQLPRRGIVHHIHPNSPFFLIEEALDVELEDVGHEYWFRRATPGIQADRLSVEILGPVLRVRALTEVPGQRFDWRVAIPDDVSYDHITADIEHGVLNVRLPKKAPHRSVPVMDHVDNKCNASKSVNLWRLEQWKHEYRLTHPAPGVRPSDVGVKVQDAFLFVKVQGPNGRFARELCLPPAVDVNAIKTDITDGMLIVKLPKLRRDVFNDGDDIWRIPDIVSPTESEEEEALYRDARLATS